MKLCFVESFKNVWLLKLFALTLHPEIKHKAFRTMAKSKESLNKRTSDRLTYDEYMRLLSCLDEDKKYFWEAYAVLQFCTGLRVSDVRTLTWKQVLGNGFYIKEIKTGKVRYVPIIDPTAQDKIQELYKKMGKPSKDSLVMTSNKTSNNGKALTEQYVNRVLKKWKSEYHLDIENFSTHTFRKTFGRHFYDSVDENHRQDALVMLSEVFRHSDTKTTRKYLGIQQHEINSVFSHIFSR